MHQPWTPRLRLRLWAGAAAVCTTAVLFSAVMALALPAEFEAAAVAMAKAPTTP